MNEEFTVRKYICDGLILRIVDLFFLRHQMVLRHKHNRRRLSFARWCEMQFLLDLASCSKQETATILLHLILLSLLNYKDFFNIEHFLLLLIIDMFVVLGYSGVLASGTFRLIVGSVIIIIIIIRFRFFFLLSNHFLFRNLSLQS